MLPTNIDNVLAFVCPHADSFVVARDCTAPAISPLVGTYCLSVPSSLSPLSAPLALAERGYLQVDALTGPAYDEMLMPRAFLVDLSG